MEQIILTPFQLNIIILIGLWTLPWKGIALWKSSQKNQKVWFIAMLLLNTVGILEILYIFVFSKMKKQKNLQQPHNSTPIQQ